MVGTHTCAHIHIRTHDLRCLSYVNSEFGLYTYYHNDCRSISGGAYRTANRESDQDFDI